ncbi:hypothetical protein PSN45_003628 [Yamadazyma tenuis]|uniref:PX domain-containing protein n=1 Tax=Candida tenuis (strain ATCC 10573 / BCRC 21748 / CBS 615 / JCM 9827 / NBRC 10315 / NRRL Y-1498 / VKM Y-70) TaxID=590646 RepID=G3AZJ1_CANTC|nr:uncharacterized protein CANTEDRAFT_96726 [Yamadazyma tenuis ATCC 10573]EGV65591.1 hypothetical protein CANTEDRAFT_96726 [Yamadazyma tenuis ATCC 10573]WEJ96092.1 hypothetical protein PSN45_003628 [Yamadazyma tenuis]
MTQTNAFLSNLSPTEEHFLKKFLMEKRLETELKLLARPDCLQLFGTPFDSKTTDADTDSFPLSRYFFNNYINSFPFITNNTKKDQEKFWKHTVQPFVESVNQKQLSNSNDRKEHTTKRKQINTKFVSGLALFYNSVLVTPKDMEYLESEHLAPSDVGKLDKIRAHKTPMLQDLHQKLNFSNGLNINIVSVDKVHVETTTTWFGLSTKSTHHYEFVIQVTEQDSGDQHYVSRPYHEFKHLEKTLLKKFPGIMNIETSKLPEKFKNDANTLIKEKLRISLRGYLTSLLQFPEIVSSEEFQYFINEHNFHTLNDEQKADYEKRHKHEKHLLMTQLEFQKEVSKLMIDFSKQFDDFKIQLIKEPDTLVNIFKEIGANKEMTNLSPLLKIFIDWCKIEISATVFQIFLTQDNSNELLHNVKKFHRLFPYGIMYNILRFTNPMSIISRVISLLLINIPGTNNKNLLSCLFIMLLDEDLNGYEVEVNNVKLKLKEYPNFIAAIEANIDNKLNEAHLDIEEAIEDIIGSIEEVNKQEAMAKTKLRDSDDLFNNLKQLYQIKVRQNDKLILKSLWEEPELTRLIKNFLIIFYHPLIELLSKSKMHIFFKDLQGFNDELINLLVRINEEEIYYLSSVEVFNRLMKLMDDHIGIFWKFVHNMYNNDDSHLFLKLIQWIENFLLKLRLKYADIDKVTLDLHLKDQELDEEQFFKQLHERMDKILLKRKLFKEHYQQTVAQREKHGNSIENNWDQLHEAFNEYDTNFGLDIDELEELNFDISENTDIEFSKKISQLQTFEYSTSELDKFDPHMVKELNRVLQGI